MLDDRGVLVSDALAGLEYVQNLVEAFSAEDDLECAGLVACVQLDKTVGQAVLRNTLHRARPGEVAASHEQLACQLLQAVVGAIEALGRGSNLFGERLHLSDDRLRPGLLRTHLGIRGSTAPGKEDSSHCDGDEKAHASWA